jgi:shikimate dehydrogenase
MNQRTRFAGILGWPLDHTLSPVIHNAAYRRLDLDWVYLAFPVPPEELAAAVAGLRALGTGGVNVTMPHKERVVESLDALTPEAEALGAVNTIENAGGRLIGHNTDVEGFRAFLVNDAGAQVAGRSALVLGAGGAARAVVKVLGDLGATSIEIAARTISRAEVLAQLAPAAKVVPWDQVGAAFPEADIAVNCTPVGMEPGETLPTGDARPGQMVIDLIYRPLRTRWLLDAQERGADAWGGLGMLVHQAAASFRIWTGRRPPVEVMSAAAVRALGGGVLHGED